MDMSRMGEILAVKQLGDKIGYGNMMDIASALWCMDETERIGKEAICHVSTVLPCLKKKEAIRTANEVQARIREIRNEDLI
jgi:hypothetical protein